MPDPTRVALAMVIDRSGSMQSIKNDAEGGVNAFIAEQRGLPGSGRLLLTQFDDVFDIVQDWVNLADAQRYELQPRGMTALLDAWGRTTTLLEERLAGEPEEIRPGRVVVVVVTDGQENSSREWTREDVLALTRRKQEQDGWEFVFLAAGQDAIATAAHLGVRPGAALTYDADGDGTAAAYAAASRWVASARDIDRDGAPVMFTDEDRAQAAPSAPDPGEGR